MTYVYALSFQSLLHILYLIVCIEIGISFNVYLYAYSMNGWTFIKVCAAQRECMNHSI